MKKYRQLLKIIFILILWTGTPIRSYCQNVDSLRKELQKVSLQLYKDHNRNFLIVDAILDGLIKMSPYAFSSTTFSCNGKSTSYIDQPSEPKQVFSYIFVYQDGAIKISDKPLNDVENMIYFNKIKFFYSHGNDALPHTFTLSNFFLDLKDIFDPSSSFRRGTTLPWGSCPDRTIINMLVEDKLLDTSTDYKVVYDIDGLFINNEMLGVMTATKYIFYINEHGFTPKSAADRLYIDKKNIRCNTGSGKK